MIRAPQVSQLATYLGGRDTSLADFPITLDEARQGIVRLVGEAY
jgi:hypothetical protein